jgi:LysM repeat protein
MKRFLINMIAVFFLGLTSAQAQKKEAVLAYIETYQSVAIDEMIRTGVPAAITLAQGIHESGAGLSDLVLQSNNHFGIKCKTGWTGETVLHDDDARSECFRKYASPADSYKDHSDFLKNSPRYVSLFSIDPQDYKSWAKGLKAAGYATNPKYPEVLIKLIEDYNLEDFTLIALGKKPGSNPGTTPADVQPKTAVYIDTEPAQQAYPDYQFKINETKVVFIKKGVSYLSVAQQYHLDLSYLFKFNDMSPAEQTETDQLIYLQPKRKTGNNDFHTVKPGETLRDISQSEAIRLDALQELNWLKDGQMPAVGEALALKKKSDRVPKLALKDNYTIFRNGN